MSSPASGIVSTPTIYGKVDYGPTFGNVYRPLNPKRIVTASGTVFIQPFDVIIIVQQDIPGPVTLNLPNLINWMKFPYGGFDLTIKNRNFGFDMTIVPVNPQTIDGLPSIIYGGGQGEGAIVLSPLNDLSGWDTL